MNVEIIILPSQEESIVKKDFVNDPRGIGNISDVIKEVTLKDYTNDCWGRDIILSPILRFPDSTVIGIRMEHETFKFFSLKPDGRCCQFLECNDDRLIGIRDW